MAEHLGYTPDQQLIYSSLQKILNPDAGYFFKEKLRTPPLGLRQVSFDYHKLIYVANLNTFIKLFAPITGDYAEKYVACLTEMQGIKLPKPILQPNGLIETAVFFPIGKFRSRAAFLSEFTTAQLDELRECAQKYGLEIPAITDQVDVVELDGQQFYVDMIDDGGSTLNLYADSLSTKQV